MEKSKGALKMDFAELSESQLKQYTNAEQAFHSYRALAKRAVAYRGGMIWRTQSGKDYLIKTSPDAKQRGLGPRSPDTEKTYNEFLRGKQMAESALAAAKQRQVEIQRMNKALRIGHCPNIVVAILQALEKERISDHFMVVGTNALYAYEAQAGVHFVDGITATEDLDILWDSRRKISLVMSDEVKKDGLIGVLKKVDPTFMMMPDEPYRATNGSSFLVDLIKRRPASLYDDKEPQQIFPNEHDFWAAKIRNVEWLLHAPKFKQVVVATNGQMAEMVAPDPRAFVLYKAWMASKEDRNPTKKPRDFKQARAVHDLIVERMPQLSFDRIHTFPESMRNVDQFRQESERVPAPEVRSRVKPK